MKPIVTEKAVMKIESENVLTFQIPMKMKKQEIKQKVEEIFDVKIEKIRTQIRDNKKIAYVKLKPTSLAIDVATKLGIM